MKRHYVKIGPFWLTAWQYEIMGCSLFLGFALLGIVAYLTAPKSVPNNVAILTWLSSTMIVLLVISDVLNVYKKDTLGFYDLEYKEDDKNNMEKNR